VHLWSLLRYYLGRQGPLELLLNTLRWQLDPDGRHEDPEFDRRYGTETALEVTPEEGAVPPPRRPHAIVYWPTPRVDFEAMLAALGWTAAQLGEATFLDLGSGKGRVVLLAAEHPFRRIVGLEISPVLVEAARRNLARWAEACGRQPPVELALGDAAEVEVPAGPLAVFLFHPFEGPVAARALARLGEALDREPRPLALLYLSPWTSTPLPDTLLSLGGRLQLHARRERKTRFFRSEWTIWYHGRPISPEGP
jgi:SAM-dependent methyltransferase